MKWHLKLILCSATWSLTDGVPQNLAVSCHLFSLDILPLSYTRWSHPMPRIQIPVVISVIIKFEYATQICPFSSSCLLNILGNFFMLFECDMTKVLLVVFSVSYSTLVPNSLVASPSMPSLLKPKPECCLGYFSSFYFHIQLVLDSLLFNYRFSTCFSLHLHWHLDNQNYYRVFTGLQK